jgi:trimeric autotransporter adhesin
MKIPCFFLLFLLAYAVQLKAQVPAYVPSTGLLAWYPFNSSAVNATGISNNGIAVGGVTYGTDRFGTPASCYVGNGTSGVDMPINNFPSGNATRSVSAWFKSVLPYTGPYQQIFATGSNAFAGCRFGLYTDGTQIGFESAGSVVVHPYTIDTSWHHLVVTYPVGGTGSSSVKVYYDGVLASTIIYTPLSIFNTDTGKAHCMGTLFLPAYWGYWYYSWRGSLDDIGVWNRELNACEVWQLYTGSTPGLAGLRVDICAGDTFTVRTSMPGGTWSSSNTAVATIGPATGLSTLVTGISAGVTTIGYSPTGCGYGGTITVYPTPSPITGTLSINLCAGVTTTLNSTPPGGIWLSSNPSVATIGTSSGIVTGISGGTTNITYLVGGLCRTDTGFTVSTSTSPITGTLSICNGGTTTLHNAASGGTWTSGAPTIATVGSSTGIVSGLSAGTAVITYSTSGCFVTTVVTVNPMLPTITGILNTCVGNTSTLSNSAPGGTWTSGSPGVATIGSSSGIVTGVALGTAIITYSVGSCFVTTTVTVNPLPSAITGPLNINLCAGAASVLSSTPAGGIWTSSNTGVATIGSSTGIVTGISGGTSNITYTISAGCYQTTTVTVNPTMPPITGRLRICAGDTAILSNLVPGGVWTSGNTAVATIGSSDGIVTSISTGTAVITYSFGISCTTTATVTVNPVPVITGNANVCVGDTLLLVSSIGSGAWVSSNTAVAMVTGEAVAGVSAGTAIISFTTAANCMATKNVTVSAIPDAGTITGHTPLCPGAVATFSDHATGGKWYSSHTYVATIDSITGVVTAIGTGSTVITYVVAPNGAGCSSRAIFTLVVSPNLMTLGYNVGDIRCYGADDGKISVMVAGGTGPYIYTWSNGMSSPSITGLAAGTYVVSVKDSGTQCNVSATFYLVQPDSPQITSVQHKDACNSGTGSISVSIAGGTAPYHYKWSNGDTTNEINQLIAGDYTLALTDGNGCLQNLAFTISDTVCGEINVYNGISPNGDGINDTWVIGGIENFPASTVQVFDKFGDVVFEKTGYRNDWNGTGKNGTVPDGTYYYLVKLNAAKAYTGKGTFTGAILIKR